MNPAMTYDSTVGFSVTRIVAQLPNTKPNPQPISTIELSLTIWAITKKTVKYANTISIGYNNPSSPNFVKPIVATATVIAAKIV